MPPRIYLDNAATSWPKPTAVYEAVDRAQREIGATAGRGAYGSATEAARIVEQTRNQLARLIGAPRPQNIAFSFNCTDGLSTAILGFLKQGDHVITSVIDHNSVLRPLMALQQAGTIEVSIVACDQVGRISPCEVLEQSSPKTRLVCLPHVSNVTGTIQPIEEIGQAIRAENQGRSEDAQIKFLVDGAQSIGHLELDVQALSVDMLAAAGHKGLMGPLGTGFLYASDDVADRINPLRFGGTGTDGSLEFQPNETPQKFESGNLNVPGIAGLQAGLNFLNSEAGHAAHANWQTNSQRLLDGLLSIDGVELLGPTTMDRRIGVFSIWKDGLDCRDAAAALDSAYSIQTRAGLHCAPLMHRHLKTEPHGGTLRLSLGLFNTAEQVETTVEAVKEVFSELL